MFNLLTKIFICLYWIVLIALNIYNYRHTPKELKVRNGLIKSLIAVNGIVILGTILCLFLG